MRRFLPLVGERWQESLSFLAIGGESNTVSLASQSAIPLEKHDFFEHLTQSPPKSLKKLDIFEHLALRIAELSE